MFAENIRFKYGDQAEIKHIEKKDNKTEERRLLI